ncbi:MAG: hypothetical protein IJU32_02610, partial [Pyramidobacter sp.]|nr:hypothetical protein [Pyramidobacter sp.]
MQIRKTLNAVKKAREFTDREAPRRLFWDQYEKTKAQPGSVHVLNYYGIGGIGKSRLLRQLAQEMGEKAPDSVVLSLDFNTRQEML